MRSTPYVAEFIGTFVLVLGGCGSAILAGRSKSQTAAAEPARCNGSSGSRQR